jgi:hypothetical protein
MSYAAVHKGQANQKTKKVVARTALLASWNGFTRLQDT